jgi:cytoskeletal protein CcmA (bactofilin family)
MAKKSDIMNVSTIDTIIGSGVRLRGNLSSDGDVAIDGSLVGNIKSSGHVTVGANGRISGSIQAISVGIAGQVEGNVTAPDSVSLQESANLHGDVETERLEVTLGAIFIGTSKMKPPKATEVATRTEIAE